MKATIRTNARDSITAFFVAAGILLGGVYVSSSSQVSAACEPTPVSAAVSAPVSSAVSAPTSCPAPTSTLSANSSLTVGQSLRSDNGQYKVVFNADGNLVAYNAANQAYWSSNTQGQGGRYLYMQNNGDFIMYNANWEYVWGSNTPGTGTNNRLVMQNDGNLVLYTPTNTAIWSIKTGVIGIPSTLPANGSLSPGQSLRSPNGQYKVVFQNDGNVVAYNAANQVYWNTATYGKGARYLYMQGDGNLVVYTAAWSALWASGTPGNGINNRFVVQDNGTLSIIKSNNVSTWNVYPVK